MYFFFLIIEIHLSYVSSFSCFSVSLNQLPRRIRNKRLTAASSNPSFWCTFKSLVLCLWGRDLVHKVLISWSLVLGVFLLHNHKMSISLSSEIAGSQKITACCWSKRKRTKSKDKKEEFRKWCTGLISWSSLPFLVFCYYKLRLQER